MDNYPPNVNLKEIGVEGNWDEDFDQTDPDDEETGIYS